MSDQEVNLRVKVTADTAGAKKATTAIEELKGSLGGFASKLASIKSAIVGFGGLFGSMIAGLGVRKIIEIGANFQMLRVQLETATGSARNAEAAFTWIKKFAADTPFEVKNLVEAFVRLRNVGFKPTEDMMRTLGDAAGAYGQDITDLVDKFVTASFGEFRGLKQLGIEADTAGDKIKLHFRGVTTTVENNSKAIMAALLNISKTAFEGGMVRASKTFTQAVSNMSDAFSNFADKLAQTGFLDALADQVRQLTTWMTNNSGVAESWGRSLIDVVNKVSAIVKTMAEHWDAIKIVLMAVVGIQLASWGLGVVASVVAISKALLGVGAAATAAGNAGAAAGPKIAAGFGPLGLIIMGLTAAYFAAKQALAQWADDSMEQTAKMVKGANEVGGAYQLIIDKTRQVTAAEADAMRSGMDASESRLQALREQMHAAEAKSTDKKEGYFGNRAAKQQMADLYPLIQAEVNEFGIRRRAVELLANHTERIKDNAAAVADDKDKTTESEEALKRYTDAMKSATDEARSMVAALAMLKGGKATPEHIEALMQAAKQLQTSDLGSERVKALAAQIEAAAVAAAHFAANKQAFDNDKAETRLKQIALYASVTGDNIEDVKKAFDQLPPTIDATSAAGEELIATFVEQARAAGEFDIDKYISKLLAAAAAHKQLVAEVRDYNEQLRQAKNDHLNERTFESADSDAQVTAALKGRHAVRVEMEKQNALNQKGVVLSEQEAETLATQGERIDANNKLLALAADVSRTTWEKYGQFAISAIESVAGHLKGAIAQAITEGGVKWKDLWQSLMRDLLGIFLDFLEEMVKNWVKQHIFMAAVEAATTGKQGGSTKGTGKGGGVSYTGAAQAAYGQSTAGGGAGYGAYGSTLGVAAIWAAIIAIGLNMVKTHGTPKLTGSFTTGGTSGFSFNGTDDRDVRSQKSVKQFNSAMMEFLKAVKDFIRNIGGVMGSAETEAQLLIRKIGRGKHTNWIVQGIDGLKQFGKDQQAAMEYAMIQAVKASPVTGLPREVKDAITRSAATTIDQFNKDIADAYEAVFARLGEVGTQVYQVFQKYQKLIDEQISAVIETFRKIIDKLSHPEDQGKPGGGTLGGLHGGGSGGGASGGNSIGGGDIFDDAVNNYLKKGPGTTAGPAPDSSPARAAESAAITKQIQDVTRLIAARNQEIQSIRDGLLGIDSSSAKRLADMQSYQDGIAEMTAGTQAEIDKVQQTIAGLESSGGDPAVIERLKGALQGYIEELKKIPEALSSTEVSMGVFDTLYKYLQGSHKYEADRVKYAKMKVELEFAAMKAQLITLGKWEEFAGMFDDAYRAALAAAGKNPGGGGKGGTKKEDKKNLKEWLESNNKELNLSGLKGYTRALAELNQKYDDEKKLAHGDKDLLKQLNDQREREQGILAAQTLENANKDLAAFEGVDPFQAIADHAAEVLQPFTDLFNDGRISATAYANAVNRVTAAQNRAAKTTELQMKGDLFSGLASFIKDDKIRIELERQAAIANFQLKMIQLKLEYQQLLDNGKLTDAQILSIGGAIAWIDAHTGPDGAPPGYDDSGGDTASRDAWRTYYDDRKNLIDQLNDLADTTDPVTKRLHDLNKQFEDLRFQAHQYGISMELVDRAYQVQLAKFWKEVLQPITDWNEKQKTAETNPQSPLSQLNAAQAQFEQTVAAYRAGDLSKIEKLPELADQLLQLGQGYYGTSTASYQHLFDLVNTVMQSIDTSQGHDVVLDAITTQTSQQATDQAMLRQTIDTQTAEIVGLRRDINRILARLPAG